MKEVDITVLVCGGRDYNDRTFVYETLNTLHATYRIIQIVHGDCRGADRLAGEWARDNQVTESACPADWARLGRKAGPIRNQYMLDKHDIDLVVAFDGGRGTSNMINKAKLKGLKILEPKG